MIDDIRRALAQRYNKDDRICVTAYKAGNPKTYVIERFVDGIEDAAQLIERYIDDPKILAMWSNLQKLSAGATERKKEQIEAYVNLLVDIDRHVKKDDKGNKINATDAERAVLLEKGKDILAFLKPYFGAAIVADSGNGYHLSWRTQAMPPAEGMQLYAEVLSILRTKFETPDCNMEIDISLADETQVVTVWGTWNRKYPHTEERPQRQSKLLSTPGKPAPVLQSAIELFCAENVSAAAEHGVEQSHRLTANGKLEHRKADPFWLENYGPAHYFEWAQPYLDYEGTGSYEKNGEEHHPSSNCPAHDDDGYRTHNGEHHCEIILYPNDEISFSCFSAGIGIGGLIQTINKLKGESYPYRIFVDDTVETVLEFTEEDEPATDEPATEPDPEPEPAARAVLPGETPRLAEDGTTYVEQPNGEREEVTVAQQTEPVATSAKLNEGEIELARGVPKGTKSIYSFVVVRASDIEMLPVDWLWPDKIPMGEINIFAGPPGCGKSLVTDDIAARVTLGQDWADGSKNEWGPKSVLIAAAEDDMSRTIIPRLKAAGADLDRISIFKHVQITTPDKLDADVKRQLQLKADVKLLRRTLVKNPDIALVIFDPITGFWGEVDQNKDRDMRPIMQDVQQMCEYTRTSIIGIMHHNKRGDADALAKIQGAGAIVAVARAVWGFESDPENRKEKLMSLVKGNISEKESGMRYRLDKVAMLIKGKEKNIPRIEWLGETDETAEDVLSRRREKKGDREGVNDTKLDKGSTLILAALQDGPRLARDLYELGKAEGISDKTMQRCNYGIGVEQKKMPSGPWYWKLPGQKWPWVEAQALVPDTEVM